MDLLIYLLQVVAYSGVFALVYRLLLERHSAAFFNRRFLVAALILPFLLPLLKLPALSQSISVNNIIDMKEVLVGVHAKAKSVIGFNWSLILEGFYFCMVMGLLLRFVLQQVRFSLQLKQAPKIRLEGMSIAVINGCGPGSFNGQIFFPDNEVNRFMLRHEMAHVHQHHHIDLWLAQLSKIVGWANPFVYYLAAQLKMVHEYEADTIAGSHEPLPYAEALLAHVFQVHQVSIAHSFFHHPIKKRIIMLQKQNQKKQHLVAKMAAILAIVLFSGSVIVAQTAKQVHKATPVKKPVARGNNQNSSENVFRSVSVMPEFDGNVS